VDSENIKKNGGQVIRDIFYQEEDKDENRD